MQASRKRKLIQAFTAPKDKNTKAILKQNSTSSPLLRLPQELRQKIWGYVLGHRLIHIAMTGVYPWYNYYGDVFKPRLFNTRCQAPITEIQAYELSKSAEYDQTAFKDREDLRCCDNRHAICYSELQEYKEEAPPPNRLDVSALTVCRQVYVDANPILWSTNIWSFRCKQAWNYWRFMRNAVQRRLIKKIHLGRGLIFDYITKAAIAELKALEELNIDFNTYTHGLDDINKIQQCYQAKTISVIANDTHMISLFSSQIPFEERVSMAESCRSHLMHLQLEAARKKEEKASAKLLIGDKDSDSNGGAESKAEESQMGENEN
ncbi:hypothetical protein N431DRAFT_503178 [Stipitochalara longipes BDJ]|nr:hypothetical protein N431DRAFT_503178 [Stipitochalara longipes BDJ]